MISKLSMGGKFNTNISELVGLSTDTKPINEFNGTAICNGSYFYEMDTKKLWQFDEENKQWLEQ